MIAPSSRVQVPSVCWSWEGSASVEVGQNKWPIRIDPTPGYAHDAALVARLLAACEDAFPVPSPPLVYVLEHDDAGRVNGQTNYDRDWKSKDQHGRPTRAHYIVLFGKRIPPHPAVTRYLVAHEYGHVVEDVLALRRYKSAEPEAELLEEYARLRALPPPPSFCGPGTWHQAHGEIFANDFRILICGVESEFWPHPGIPRPEDVPGLREWWEQAQAEARAAVTP